MHILGMRIEYMHIVPLKSRVYGSLFFYFFIFICLNNTVISANLFPYRMCNVTLKLNFSITSRQKLKIKLYSDRARLAL